MPTLVAGTSCGDATKSPANGIFCSRQDTEVLQRGQGGAETDGRSVGVLPCDQGTCRKDTVSPVSTGLLPLFTVSPVFGSGPRHKQQHSWIRFHSFSQSKQTQHCPLLQLGGQQGRLHPPMDTARRQPALGWVLQAAPSTSRSTAKAPPCILLVGETSPSLSMAESLRVAMPLAQQ